MSLSEDPELEVPVARTLPSTISSRAPPLPASTMNMPRGYDPLAPSRLPSRAVGRVGGHNQAVVAGIDDFGAPDSLC